ncbi:MAG: PAS domain S-box protein [Syntrophales bacterium]|jgi:PAS domain S-box-containing protein
MTKKVPRSKQTDDLRRRAEKKITGSMDSTGKMSIPEIQKLVHELHVHQIELEMQNEALRQSQTETAESQYKYSDLYDFAPVGYFTFDKRGHIIEANITGASLLGAEKRSLAKQPFQRFIVPGYFSIFQSHLQKAPELRSKQTCKLKLIGKDGSLFDALIDTIVVIDGEGKFDHYRSAVTDITEITRAEALRESEIRYRGLYESTRDGMVMTDTEGHILQCNRAYSDMLGYTEEEIRDLTYQQTTPAKWHDTEKDIINNKVLKTGYSDIYEKEYIRKDGTVFPIFMRMWAIEDETGNITGMWGIVSNITERKRVEMELAERTKQLEAANKELESFSYSVAHDLRAPLRAIDGFARIILRKQGDKFDKDTLDKFNVIRSNTHMMGQLIDDLLAFSRLGKKHMSLAILDMDDLVREIWKEIQNMNPARNMVLTANSIPSGYGDRALIKQVYINLLSNAVKFTKYRDTTHIEAGGYSDGNEVVYYVRDNGIGFDMEYCDKLFGVFQRLHRSDDFEGTGVGLAIIQRIVHRHGGRVWAEGKVNEGATFYFSLPSSHTIDAEILF